LIVNFFLWGVPEDVVEKIGEGERRAWVVVM